MAEHVFKPSFTKSFTKHSLNNYCVYIFMITGTFYLLSILMTRQRPYASMADGRSMEKYREHFLKIQLYNLMKTQNFAY